MKILVTSAFDAEGYKPLNDLIIKNRKDYIARNPQWKSYWTVDPVPYEHKTWRHAKIILDALKNPAFRDCDIIVNTGQRNLVTNFEVRIEDKVNCFMGEDHAMILQGWAQNPSYYNRHWIFNASGDVELVKTDHPYLNITAE